MRLAKSTRLSLGAILVSLLSVWSLSAIPNALAWSRPTDLDLSGVNCPESPNCQVFEVDMASVQDFKIKKIKKHFGALPSNVNYIPIDFNNQTLGEVLKLHQFEFSKPTFIIWEGVTQYITKDAVEKTLDFISAIAPGSYLAFTYILESVIMKQSSIPGANELMKYFEKKNFAWQFGIEPDKLSELLEKYHLQLLSDIDSDYYQEKYLEPMGRELDTTKMERVAFAKR